MVNTKKVLFCLFVFVLVSFSCFSSGNKEVAPVEKKSQDLRIISLAPNATEIIYALDAGDCLVGRTNYCNYPEEVSNVQSIGDLFDPNIEVIMSLQPDIVIATSIVSPDFVETLKNAGINVYQFFHEYEGLEGANTLISEIGSVINRKEEAEQIIEKNRKIVERIKEQSEGKEPKSCALIITWGQWGDYAATGDTFLSDLIDTANGINIAEEGMYWAISKELLISSDPEFIFITSDSNMIEGDIVKAFKNTEPYSMLSASKKDNVYVLEGDAVSRQGIRSFEILQIIADIINE